MKFSFMSKLSGKAILQLTFALTFLVALVIVALKIIDQGGRANEQKPEHLSLSLIEDRSFVKSLKARTKSENEPVLVEAAKILLAEIHTVTDNKHSNFVPGDFNKVIPVIDFMLAVDPENGHAIYFRGEVYRLLNDNDRFTFWFRRYLELEDSVGSGLTPVTDPKLCYDTPHGFCERRTAWISQLLADYYYREGISEPDLQMREKSFSNAIRFIQNVRVHFPAGFDSSSVNMSTAGLEAKLGANHGK